MVGMDNTDMKEVATHFIKRANLPISSSVFAKTIKQIKPLQGRYNKLDVMAVIDYIFDVKKTNAYSFGYVVATMDSFLKEAIKYQNKNTAKEAVSQMSFESNREVMATNETTSRNRNKAGEIGSESGFRKKFTGNLHTETGENN